MKQKSMLRILLACFAGVAVISSALAQSAVTKIVVAYPPGGTSDVTARVLADRLGAKLGRSVIVENRPGADGIIALDYVSKAAADGSVLAFAAISPFSINAQLKKLPFETTSLKPLLPIMYSPGLLVATPATDAKTLPELLDRAKKSPGSVRWGNSGGVSLGTLILEQLRAASKADIINVPYKGGGQQIVDAISGQFEVMAINAAPTIVPHIKSGKLRVLAVNGPARLDIAPNAPTLAELGYADANLVSYFGIFVPKAVPPGVADSLTRAFSEVLSDPEVKSKLSEVGNVVVHGTAADLAARIATESVQNAKIIKSAGITAD